MISPQEMEKMAESGDPVVVEPFGKTRFVAIIDHTPRGVQKDWSFTDDFGQSLNLHPDEIKGMELVAMDDLGEIKSKFGGIR